MVERKFLDNNSQSQQSNQYQCLNKMHDQFSDTMNKIPSKTSSISIKRMNNELCFEQTDRNTGNKFIGLIDMRLNNNFISKENAKNGKAIQLTKPFFVETIYGKTKISHYVRVNLFSYNMPFLIIDDLQNFDFVLGMIGLRKMNVTIDFLSLKLTYGNKIEKGNQVCSNRMVSEVAQYPFQCKNVGKFQKKIEQKPIIDVVKNEIIRKGKICANQCTKKAKKVRLKNPLRRKKIEFLIKIFGKSILKAQLISLPIKFIEKNIRGVKNVTKDFKYFEPG